MGPDLQPLGGGEVGDLDDARAGAFGKVAEGGVRSRGGADDIAGQDARAARRGTPASWGSRGWPRCIRRRQQT